MLAVMVVLGLEGLLLSPLLLFSPPRLACLAAPSSSLLCVAGAVCVGVVCGCVGACFLVEVTLGFGDHYLRLNLRGVKCLVALAQVSSFVVNLNSVVCPLAKKQIVIVVSFFCLRSIPPHPICG